MIQNTNVPLPRCSACLQSHQNTMQAELQDWHSPSPSHIMTNQQHVMLCLDCSVTQLQLRQTLHRTLHLQQHFGKLCAAHVRLQVLLCPFQHASHWFTVIYLHVLVQSVRVPKLTLHNDDSACRWHCSLLRCKQACQGHILPCQLLRYAPAACLACHIPVLQLHLE